MLVLQSLHIYRTGYGENEHLKCDVAFKGSANSEVKLNLTDEHVKGVLKVLAGSIESSAREVAETLTAEVIESASSIPALEDNS